MTEPPSPLRMLLSRHTKRRDFITLLGGWPAPQIHHVYFSTFVYF